MSRLPRNVSGKKLCAVLQGFGFVITRQTGSHIRLTLQKEGNDSHLTVPDHNEIKIGTLNAILKETCNILNIDITEILKFF